jgi:hypothetical protein
MTTQVILDHGVSGCFGTRLAPKKVRDDRVCEPLREKVVIVSTPQVDLRRRELFAQPRAASRQRSTV